MVARKILTFPFVALLLLSVFSIQTQAATVSGTVYQSDGTTPVTGNQIVVNAFSGFCGSGGIVAYGFTNPADGTYTISGLGPGTYYLATGNMNQSDYINEWWASAGSNFNCNVSQPVLITTLDDQVTGKDFQLDLGGSISGTVYESDGMTPLTAASIQIEAVSGSPCGTRNSVNWAQTNTSDGTYTMRGVPLGTGYLWSNNLNQSDYVNEWWASPLSTYQCSGAQTVSLSTPGQAITGMDFQLDLGGSISGTVTGDYGPIEDLIVQAYSGQCWNGWLGSAMTDQNGNYFIDRLPPIDVYVVAQADASQLNYVTEWYDDTIVCQVATPVPVVSETNQPGIDFVLTRGPKRVLSYEVVVGNGNLNPFFWVQPAFRAEISSATVTMPNTDRGTGGVYTFDLTNDKILWSSECRYINGWQKNFGTVEPEDYGPYTFTINFQDGAQESYTYTLHDVPITAVSDISVTVNDDGSVHVTWNRNTSVLDHYYEVRVRDSIGQQEIFKSQTYQNIEELNIPASALGCLEIDKTYRWLVRVYDNVYPLYSKNDSQYIEFPYSPGNFTNRFRAVAVQKYRGALSFFFDTRPGSRDYVKSIRVTGPGGFSYYYNLVQDLVDLSTETRINRGWWKSNPAWPIADGLYTFTVEYDDDLNGTTDVTEYVSRNLSADSFSVGDNNQMQMIIGADGSMNFFWALGSASNLRYEVRVRNLDQTKEYFVSSWLADATNLFATFNNFRAMVPGETYVWFVRVYSPDGDTMEQSATRQFLYDPFPVYDATAATFGPDSATITNPYLPFEVGKRLNYSGTVGETVYGRYMLGEAVETVDSVECLKILIRGHGDNPDPDLELDYTYAWFAQDTQGNVWMLKVYEYEDGAGQTLFQGRDQAVLWMPENPMAGMVFQQFVDDYAQVQQTGLFIPQLSTGIGPFNNGLKLLTGRGGIFDEEQYTVPGVGIVQEASLDGGMTWNLVGGSISGQVTGQYGPLQGMWVQAFLDKCGNNPVAGSPTDENGNYTIYNLPPGGVYVVAGPGGSHLNYVQEWHPGVFDCNIASPVTVISNDALSGIDFYLEGGPRRGKFFEVVVIHDVTDPPEGRLAVDFGVQSGYEPQDGYDYPDELLSAVVTLPNASRDGGTYEFDLTNDRILWNSECRYIGYFWDKNFGPVLGPDDVGEYTLTLTFRNGDQEIWTWNLEDVAVVPVSNIAVNVNNDGSALVSWDRGTTSDYYYQVRVKIQGGPEVLRSSMYENIEQLNLSAYDLRCLEIGTTYVWRVRTYDSSGKYNAQATREYLYTYAPGNLTNRYTSASVQKFRGDLGIFFDTRPGSRDYVKSITVTGPGEFSYGFDLQGDSVDLSTETRFLKGWFKSDPLWPVVGGTYTFTVEYDDDLDGTTDFTEYITRTLTVDTFTVGDNNSLEAMVFPDGSMNFFWALGSIPGLTYEVRVRNVDQTLEYYASNRMPDSTGTWAAFNNLRAMVPGQTYLWFVRVYSADGDTMEQSASRQFLYDPFPVYDATAATFDAGSATITHQYLPFKVGDKLIYTGIGNLAGYGRYWEALATEVVDGVNCLKIAIRGGEDDPDPDNDPDADAWVAQDTDGNVWLLQVYDYEMADFPFSGKDQAILWMPASPVVGQIFRQMMDEYTQVQTTGLEVNLGTGLGPYQNCLKLVWNDVGNFDYEYLAPGVGLVKEEWYDFGGPSGWELQQVIRAGAYGDELVIDFGNLGTWHYDAGAWNNLSDIGAQCMMNFNGSLLGDFGPLGLWLCQGPPSSPTWTQFSAADPENDGNTMIPFNNGVIIDFGGLGLWFTSDGIAWDKLSDASPQFMATYGNYAVFDFGGLGVWRYEPTTPIPTWIQLSGADPDNTGNAMIAFGNGIIIDFGGAGLWFTSDGIAWDKLSDASPQFMATYGNYAVFDFGGLGVWRYEPTTPVPTWIQLSGADPDNTSNAMIAFNNGIIIDFGGAGLWFTSDGIAWDKLSDASPESMAAYGTFVVFDFGGLGVWQFDGAGWSPVSDANPDNTGNAFCDVNLVN